MDAILNLNMLPEWLFISTYVVPPLLLMWLIHLGFQKFASQWELKDRDENMAAGGIASAAALTGIVLAFVLALTNQAIDSYQSEISIEAAQIRNLDKLLTAAHSKQFEDCRKPLLNYSKSIVQDEWPQLQQQRGSTITTSLLTKLDTCLLASGPKTESQSVIYLEIVKLSSQITQSREMRIANSSASLSPLFWFVMHLGLLLTIILSALSFYTPGTIRVINCSIQVITLSILMALTMVLDRPFSSQSNGVTNLPIVDAIAHLESQQ